MFGQSAAMMEALGRQAGGAGAAAAGTDGAAAGAAAGTASYTFISVLVYLASFGFVFQFRNMNNICRRARWNPSQRPQLPLRQYANGE